MRPKVSVVIPVYNRAQLVLPTLKSVQDQTMGDFECIVVDDGSKDGEDLQRLVENLGDARFRYLRRDNGGVSAARNTGVDQAEGAIVAFLDSDDRWLPDKLERDVAAGAGSRIVFSPVMVERGGRIVGERPTVAPRLGEPMAEYLACRQGFTQPSTMALPAALAKTVRFDESISFGGDDADYAIRLAEKSPDFLMLGRSSVIMTDDETGERLSRSQDWVAALAWLDRIRPTISERAFLAFRGWHVARMAADAGQYATALRFYSAALVRGVLPPPLAAKALAQIFIRRPTLRKLQRLGGPANA
jgi:glycosyltransferase involved in cell wall biosynthesis